eukprot:RCo034350
MLCWAFPDPSFSPTLLLPPVLPLNVRCIRVAPLPPRLFFPLPHSSSRELTGGLSAFEATAFSRMLHWLPCWTFVHCGSLLQVCEFAEELWTCIPLQGCAPHSGEAFGKCWFPKCFLLFHKHCPVIHFFSLCRCYIRIHTGSTLVFLAFLLPVFLFVLTPATARTFVPQ